jgi:hypothetical protein
MADRPGIDLQHVQPKLFGRVPPLGLLGAGAVLLLAAIALLALADWVLGPLLLVLALALLGLYLVAARQLPSSRLARGAVGGVWRGRDELRLAGAYAGAWTRAGWRVVCVEHELRGLRRRRDAAQHELGGAVYREDEAEADGFRARMRELDEQIAECTNRIQQAKLEAQARVGEARLPTRPTEIKRA